MLKALLRGILGIRQTVLTLLVLLSFVSASLAGHYTVAYSDGNMKLQLLGSSTIYDTPYSNGSSGYGIDHFSLHVRSANCSGAITATFTWVPDTTGEPAPDKAVIRETSDVSASSGSSSGSSSCSSGLPNETGTTAKHGYRVTIKDNPGPSFTVTCSPTASSSDPTGNNVSVGGLTMPLVLLSKSCAMGNV